VSIIIQDWWRISSIRCRCSISDDCWCSSVSATTAQKENVWVKPRIQVRPVCGAYSSLISDLRNTDESAFRN